MTSDIPKYDFKIEDGVLIIEDLDEGGSVTNNALQVVLDVQSKLNQPLNKRPIVYMDSYGDWDVIQFRPNHIGFLSGGGSKTTAKLIAKKHAEYKLN